MNLNLIYALAPTPSSASERATIAVVCADLPDWFSARWRQSAPNRKTTKCKCNFAYVFRVYYVCVYSVCVCFQFVSVFVCVLCVLCVCALYNFCHSHLLLQLLLLRDVAGVAAFVTGDKQTDEGLGVVNNNNCCLDSM